MRASRLACANLHVSLASDSKLLYRVVQRHCDTCGTHNSYSLSTAGLDRPPVHTDMSGIAMLTSDGRVAVSDRLLLENVLRFHDLAVKREFDKVTLRREVPMPMPTLSDHILNWIRAAVGGPRPPAGPVGRKLQRPNTVHTKGELLTISHHTGCTTVGCPCPCNVPMLCAGHPTGRPMCPDRHRQGAAAHPLHDDTSIAGRGAWCLDNTFDHSAGAH